jgi:hypothetical protein
VGKLNETLMPNAWKWTLAINGYPYKQSYSRLAVKMVVEAAGPLSQKSSLPSEDCMETGESMAGILIGISPSLPTPTGPYSEDVGFFAWESEANLYTSDNDQKTVSVATTNILAPEKDIYSTLEEILVLNSTADGRVESEARSFIYFSFPEDNPCSIVWDPYTGLNQAEESYDSSSNLLVPSLLSVLLLLANIL